MSKTDQPSHGSGKTKFNREKQRGESWTKLRDDARRNGTWRPSDTQTKKEERREPK